MHPHEPSLPATPTAAMTVDGLALRPAERLHALAAIRDRHRARARAASDRGHELRAESEDRQRRIGLIEQRIGGEPGRWPDAAAEIGTLRAELAELAVARAAVEAEADEAGQAAADAARLLRAAAKFATDHGAVLPVLLQSEAR